jgi:hypothetical protein
MTEAERTRYLAVFDQAAATPPEGHDSHWLWFIEKFLELPQCYLPAAQEALRQGRWRKAKNPKGYVKTVAQREAIKMGLAPDPYENVHVVIPALDGRGRPMSHDEYIEYLFYDGPVKEGGVWHAREPWNDESEFRDAEGRVIPSFKGRPVPQDLLMLEDDEPDAQLVIDWDKVGDRAGLNEAEQDILEFRLLGFTRELILSELAKDDDDRRGLQAAWRRLTRHMDRVREVLSGQQEGIGRDPPKKVH